MEPTFDPERCLALLECMRPHQQLACGAACAERMLPSYETFVRAVGWRDAGPLRRALDAVWKAGGGQLLAAGAWRELLAECEACVPDADEFASPYTPSAQEAVFAVCSLIEFVLEGDLHHIVRVLCFSILEHPLMQQELARQQRDLRDAGSLTPGDRAALLALRTRARREPNLTLAATGG
jgi:uncharacterized protein YjaG (DUF416 family)